MAIQAQMYPDNLMGNPFGGSQDWLMDNNHNNNNNSNLFFFNGGSGLNDLGFNLQHQQQQQQQQQQVQLPYEQQQQYLVQFQNLQQRNHNHNQSLPSQNGFVFFPSSKNSNNNNNGPTTSTITTSSDHMSMNLSQSLAAQLQKQSLEIDRFITLQNERLKLGLQEQRKRQVGRILRKVEAKARVLLKEKDEEIAKARKRGIDLEEYVRKMEIESEGWKRLAAEKEAMVVSLNNTLEQLRQQGLALASSNGNGNGQLDDAQSCCDDNDLYTPAAGNDDEEETGIAGGERNMKRMVCRFCNSRKSCMLMLPCRHLCSCKACEPFIDACPLCKSPKSTSIQALFS